VLRTSHLAQLILYWIQCELEEQPDLQSLEYQHDDPLVRGMFASVDDEAQKRCQDIVTEKDKQTAKLRWLRLAIHGDLEHLHQARAEMQQDVYVQWQVEAAIMQNEECALLPSSDGKEIFLSATEKTEQAALQYQ
jgi:hypothetical protein